MNTIIQLIVSLTLGGSAVVICLQVLKFLLSDGRNKWFYRIGKIAIVLYLLPIAILLQWIFTKFISSSGRKIFTLDSAIVSDLSSHSLHFNVSMQMVVFFISVWLLGIIIFSSWQIYSYVRFTKLLQSTEKDIPDNSEVMQEFVGLKHRLQIKSNVKLKYSGAIPSPFLIGLWNPTIYLPKYYHEDINMEMIMHHELIHLKRKDVWIKTFSLIANAIHWFNPLIYPLRKDIHKWSELTCDEEVVKHLSKEERKNYGATIINVMIDTKELPVQFCSSLSDEGKQLKRRLDNMLRVKQMKKSTVLFSIIVTVLVGLIGTTTAVWASGKTPDISDQMENDHFVIEKEANEAYKFSEEMVEVEWIPESEATKEQIEAYEQLFNPSADDVDFWADVEEDSVLTNEDVNKDIIDEVELEAGIFVEIE